MSMSMMSEHWTKKSAEVENCWD